MASRVYKPSLRIPFQKLTSNSCIGQFIRNTNNDSGPTASPSTRTKDEQLPKQLVSIIQHLFLITGVWYLAAVVEKEDYS